MATSDPATKRCPKCAQDLPLDRWTPSQRGVPGAYCQSCAQEYGRAHYAANPQSYKDRATRQQMARRRLIREAKNRPCVDCNKNYPYYVMDLDHREGETKIGGLAVALQNRWPLAKIQVEIDKCDVVCANCHRIRTHERAEDRVELDDF